MLEQLLRDIEENTAYLPTSKEPHTAIPVISVDLLEMLIRKNITPENCRQWLLEESLKPQENA